MAKRTGLEYLSFRAREAVLGLIAGLEETTDGGDSLGSGLALLHNLDAEIPDILGEVMKRGAWRAQMMAAVMFFKGIESYPAVVTEYLKTVSLAERILVSSLAKPRDEDSRQATCQILGVLGIAPATVVPLLEKLLESKDQLTVAYVATALVAAPEQGAIALTVLGRLLRSDNLPSRLIAAPVLALRGYRVNEAVASLVEALPKCNVEERCGILRILQSIGPKAVGSLPVLKKMLADESLSDFFRGRAAAAIGSVTQGSRPGAELLSQHLASRDWQVVNGAAEGLAIHGGFTKADIKQLAALLESDDKDMRRIAAVCLQRFGSNGRAAIPKLIERLGREPDPQLCLGLTETLAAIGSDAVPPLIEEARKQDFRTFSLVAGSLKGIGDAAIAPIAELLLGDDDEAIRYIGVLILREMGRKAAPAIPVLAAMLDEATNLEIAHNLILTIGVCGQATEQAIHAVVNALVRCDDDDVEDIACKVLKEMGDAARASLEAALPGAPQAVRPRLDRILAACQPSAGNRFPRLEKLNRDDLLKLFALVGEVFEKYTTAGWRLVVAEIKDKVNFTRPNGVPFGMRDKSVADAIKELGTHLGVPLTENSPNQASRLTSAGTALLGKVRKYLRAKYDAP